MKRDICTRCERAITIHDHREGAKVRVYDRFIPPPNMYTARQRMTRRHDLCKNCASDLRSFLDGRPIEPSRPPAIGHIPWVKAANG